MQKILILLFLNNNKNNNKIKHLNSTGWKRESSGCSRNWILKKYNQQKFLKLLQMKNISSGKS